MSVAKNKIMMISNITDKMHNIKKRLLSCRMSVDILIFLGIITVLNMHLFGLGSGRVFIFSPQAFESGQWWRLFTHPFVHVTWYHLVLDAGAFMVLYKGLEVKKTVIRIMYVMICGAGSLGATLLFCPAVNFQGLCGISGIAHGIMAVSALEMIQKKETFRIGIYSLGILIFKCIYEVMVGDVLFSFLQFGLCGSPLVTCHAGGVAGGIMSFYLFQLINMRLRVHCTPLFPRNTAVRVR